MVSEELKRVAHSNATVGHCLYLHEVGLWTLEEALESAVVVLADQNAKLVDLASKVHLHRPIELTLVADREAMDELRPPRQVRRS